MQSPGVLLTLEEMIRLGGAYLPRGLVSASARRNLARAQSALPACFSYGCFELRLDADPRVDVLVCALREDGGARALAGERLDDSHVAQVLRWWTRARAARPVEGVWLELDRHLGARRQPPPFAFLRFTPGAPFAAALAAVGALAPPAATGATLRRCGAALRQDEQVLHLATMPHRLPKAGMRVHLGLTPARVIPYLEDIGWQGRADVVGALLAAWPQRALGVQFDLAPEVTPSVDLEFYLETLPQNDSRWHRLFDRLRAWVPGLDEARLASSARWPSTAGSAPHPRHWPIRVERRLQIKVRIFADGGVGAKAYLGFTPRLAA